MPSKIASGISSVRIIEVPNGPSFEKCAQPGRKLSWKRKAVTAAATRRNTSDALKELDFTLVIDRPPAETLEDARRP
jgi:hypothetical protein